MIISHLINLLLLITAISANHGIDDEHFDEQLIIRSLNDGQISAHFEFKTFINANLSYPFGVDAGKHNDIFPLSLLRLFHQLEIQELHFSLTKGYWKYDRWGLPARDTSPNAHLWAWFSTYLNSKNNWNKLTSLLSGQFCASINLINPTVTIRPKISYRPFLKLKPIEDKNIEHDYGYMASLPQEPICTENLTPFTKMLPCQRNKGLASLLHATNIFDTQFYSQSVDFEFSCTDINRCSSTTGIELKQNILIVFTGPLVLDGKYSWTLNSLFGSSLDSHCPLASSSRIYVDITPLNRNPSSNGQLLIEPSRFISINSDQYGSIVLGQSPVMINEQQQRLFVEYDLKSILKSSESKPKNGLNIGIQYPASYNGKLNYPIDYQHVQVRRFSRGVGVQTGGITVLLTNRFPFGIDAIYADTIPWYLRMYLHTLRIESRPLESSTSMKSTISKEIQPTKLHYEPAQDRIRPHQLEVKLHLPPNSLIEIRFEFDHQFLRWTEFPPDPNHGLYINPATVTFLFDDNHQSSDPGYTYERFLPRIFESYFKNNSFSTSTIANLQKNYPLRLYTEPLIIMMPTPDFSMPYNVICLVSTALSIAFGPIYNLTTRKVMITKSQAAAKKNPKRFFFF
ncbi:hypothetical protein DERP_005063 [Dermatophagoides pteronyssinus]|uniref:Uncharacterized protein n=2 Tax=Dermatophagoides pteronyssinus TaxID=6956 RepID=A0ABQ8JT92_DERPT|nr:GPI transamidase component PIG-T-like isoform X1 [Dermatophagoides pteronyssinus]KAH9425844.1 hypothetical protein DERP_005063 [Dermatophagoides pteronyssinus]